MRKEVTPDALVLQVSPAFSGCIALAGKTYEAWTNIHGAVAVVTESGKMLGVKPDEFMVLDWYPCCSDFERATEPCTDAELWSELIHYNPGEGYLMGSRELKPIAFCPWCGKKVIEPEK